MDSYSDLDVVIRKSSSRVEGDATPTRTGSRIKFSSIRGNQEDKEPAPMLLRLPEECLWTILKQLTPKDLCRVQLCNKDLYELAARDEVWQHWAEGERRGATWKHTYMLEQGREELEKAPVTDEREQGKRLDNALR